MVMKSIPNQIGGRYWPVFLDEDAAGDGDEGEGEDEGEEIDARENGGGAEGGLEIEREEVGAGDEDEAVDEAGGKGGNVGAFGEEAERHDWVSGEFPFIDEEEGDGDEAEDNETDDGSGVPRVTDSSVFEAEQEHDGATADGDDSYPVNGFETCDQRSLGCLNIEEEQDNREGDTVKRDWHYVSITPIIWKEMYSYG